MAFDVYEAYNSRKVKADPLTGEVTGATLLFIGVGTMDDAEARAGFYAAIPSSFLGLLPTTDGADIESPGGGPLWTCSVEYSSTTTETQDGQGGETPSPPPPPAPSPTDPIGTEYSFDISGVTEKITQSKETVYTAGKGDIAPDTKKAIGVTADGQVEGCERISPKFELTITKTFGFITLGYLNTLAQLVGTVNNATFYGFARGEVLLLGASGGPENQSNRAKVTFKLGIVKNQTGIVISDDIASVNKKGWEYLWVAYGNVSSSGKITQQPNAVYVERIYDYGDFNSLGIGA